MAETSTQATRVVQVCRYLRTKSMYIADERGMNALVEPTDTAVYWCNRTAGPMGPDDDIAGAEECREGRACYAGVPLVLKGAPD